MVNHDDFPDVLNQVEKAVVRISKKGGRGVLVDGHKILTAAHCITWECEGGMTVGDFFIEEIEMGDKHLKVQPEIVEPVMDIAVLGTLDEQTFEHEPQNFFDACEEIEPVKICTEEFERLKDIKAFVSTHDNGWIEAEVRQYRKEVPYLWISSNTQINSGTSGSPVVTENGELLGVISWISEKHEFGNQCKGRIPRPHLALPKWIYNKIISGENEYLWS